MDTSIATPTINTTNGMSTPPKQAPIKINTGVLVRISIFVLVALGIGGGLWSYMNGSLTKSKASNSIAHLSFAQPGIYGANGGLIHADILVSGSSPMSYIDLRFSSISAYLLFSAADTQAHLPAGYEFVTAVYGSTVSGGDTSIDKMLNRYILVSKKPASELPKSALIPLYFTVTQPTLGKLETITIDVSTSQIVGVSDTGVSGTTFSLEAARNPLSCTVKTVPITTTVKTAPITTPIQMPTPTQPPKQPYSYYPATIDRINKTGEGADGYVIDFTTHPSDGGLKTLIALPFSEQKKGCAFVTSPIYTIVTAPTTPVPTGPKSTSDNIGRLISGPIPTQGPSITIEDLMNLGEEQYMAKQYMISYRQSDCQIDRLSIVSAQMSAQSKDSMNAY